MAKQNFQFGQILSKTTANKSKNSSKNQRKNKKPKILMKSKGLLLNNNQHFKTTFKNVFGFKTSIKGLKFTPTDIKKYTGQSFSPIYSTPFLILDLERSFSKF
uniref:Uncharacterized protein n=1 Tax=Meloidogyne enterolobii TaxID=390850 RepID=A0A6V7XGL7_MELEN|nr:unnamed protein product [Meloidogyne enterolobii]